jgi:effector-binding domain-containing protein
MFSHEHNMGEFEVITTNAQPAISIREKVKMQDIPQAMGRMFGELMPILQKDVQCAGPPFAFYHSWSQNDTDMDVGFPVAGNAVTKGRVKPFQLPATKAVVGMHMGPYDKIVDTYNKMMEWMKTNGYEPADYMWEEYLNSPDEVPVEKLMTRLVWPIK